MSVLKAQLLVIFFSLMIKAADRNDTNLLAYELLDGSLVTCASSICVRGKQLGCDPEKVLDQCAALRGLQSHGEMRSAMPIENRERFESFFTVLQTAYLIKEKKISEIESYALLKKLGLEKLFIGASDTNKCGAIHARDMCIELLAQRKYIKKMIKSPKAIPDSKSWAGGDYVHCLVALDMYRRLPLADIFQKHLPAVSGSLLPTDHGVRLHAADNGDFLAVYSFIVVSEGQFYSKAKRRHIIASEFLAHNAQCVIARKKNELYNIVSSSATSREIKIARYDYKDVQPDCYIVAPEYIHLLTYIAAETCNIIIVATKKDSIVAYDLLTKKWSAPYDIHMIDGITALDGQSVAGGPLIYVGDKSGALCVVAYDVTNAQFSLTDIHASKRGGICCIAHNNEPLPLVLYAHSIGDLSIVNRDIKKKKYQLRHAVLGDDLCSLAIHPTHSDLFVSGHSDAIRLWNINPESCALLWRFSLDSREKKLKNICWAGNEHLSFSCHDDNCLYKIDMRDLYRFLSYAHENQNNMLIMLALHALQRKKNNKNKRPDNDMNLKKILALVPDEIKSFLDT